MTFHYGSHPSNREKYRGILTNLRDEGWTYKQMGDHLGLSRDQISGMIKRLGLQRPKEGTERGWDAKRANATNPKKKPLPKPPKPLGPIGTFPDGMDYCRYPVNADDKPFQVCANPGFPYCDHHHKICRIPVPKKEGESKRGQAIIA